MGWDNCPTCETRFHTTGIDWAIKEALFYGQTSETAATRELDKLFRPWHDNGHPLEDDSFDGQHDAILEIGGI